MALQNSSTSSKTKRPTLNELALKYGTDKSTKHHGYVLTYEKLFESMRDEPVTILELGFGGHEDPDKGGASAQMWRDYFPNGTVVVVDIEEKTITDAHKGIHFRQGSQDDKEFLDSLAAEFGPFDIAIDDASHISSLSIKSFEYLYPHLKSGGTYVLEDSHSSYHAQFLPYADDANLNPDRKARNGQTALQFFKRMSDEVNFKGRDDSDLDLFPRKYWKGYDLEYVCFKFNLVLVGKR